MTAITLRDYQEDAVSNVRQAFRDGFKALLLVLSTGAGKCLAKDTPVLMFDGSIKLAQDVLVGDLLMGHDSCPRKVTALGRGRETMYKVTPTKGDAYTVNESHILSLKITGIPSRGIFGGDGKCYRGGDICNISVKDYLQSSPTFKHMAKGWRSGVIDFSNNQKLPIPSYILGLWLGDGHTGKLSFTTADTEIANELKKYARSVGMMIQVVQNSDWSVTIHLISDGVKYGRAGSPFGNALRSLNIFNDKDIPSLYLTSSVKSRLELLAGFIDTDGYLDKKTGYCITQKSEKMLDKIVFISRSLGFAAYKSTVQKKCHNNGVVGTYYSCTINGDGVEKIPCRLDRKKAIPRKQKNNVLNVGISVSSVGVDDYYGFEITGNDRLFLLGDFTVTHNTIIFSYIAKNAVEKGNNVLILAHRDQLIKQASNKLRDYQLRHGIIMAGFTPDTGSRAQIASVQTLVRRLDKIKFKPRLIIIDEAHLSAANSYRAIVAAFPNALILGVTGSPCRLDGKSLGLKSGGLYDHMIKGISIGELIRRGFLVKPTVYAPAEQLDLSDVSMVGGDFNEKELAAVVDKPKITGSAIEHYKRICPDVPAVVWCVTIEHATHVAAEFNANGVKAVMLCGEDSSEARDTALKGLETGKVKVITFVGILIEGVDCPAIGAILLLRPTMSLSSYLQVIGRGLRPYTNQMGIEKKCCYVLDHSGLSFRHGLADEERDWELDVEPKKKGKRKPNEPRENILQCVGDGGCFRIWLKDENPLACPHCGKVLAVKTKKLEHTDGQLTEITPEMAEMMKARNKKAISNTKSLEELQRHASVQGYSPGWAKHVFEARQKAKQKWGNARPPEPHIDELKKMTLTQLEQVANEQGWPITWASNFMKSQRNLGE